MNDKYIERRYLHPRFPGALSGLHGFLKNNRYKDKKNVEKVLSSLNSYVSHKPTRKKFPRRPMICPKINSVWSVDLADMQNIKTKNKNFGFILVAIDCLSKRLYTQPLKKKTKLQTRNALENIFGTAKKLPDSIFADRGTEFVNSSVKSLLKERGIRLYHSFSHLKAFQAERAIRTLKARLYRYMTMNKNLVWITGLEDITKSINDSYNYAIGTSSNKVTEKNVSEIWQRLYDRVIKKKQIKPKFIIGDKVRVSVKKLSVGNKSYTESFGPEIFTISRIDLLHPIPVYYLKDIKGAELEGGFNQFELTRVQVSLE
jgi:hypothetical protein